MVQGSEELGKIPGGAEVNRFEVERAGSTVRLTAILFSAKNFALRVVDSPTPGQTKLAAALREAGCVAGVNGGYFHSDYRPVGLVVADGREIHPSERAKLLAGILVAHGNRAEIVRSAKLPGLSNLRAAIQCGPMLVEDGAPTAGLNAERPARRTIAATDGGGRWALIYMTSATLADAAEILTTPGALGTLRVETALNLDGGSSTGLWAAASPNEISLPELGHVRNFVGIVPR